MHKLVEFLNKTFPIGPFEPSKKLLDKCFPFPVSFFATTPDATFALLLLGRQKQSLPSSHSGCHEPGNTYHTAGINPLSSPLQTEESLPWLISLNGSP